MEIFKGMIFAVKDIAEQMNGLTNWFTSEIATIGGITITPLNIILPSVLLLILGYVIVRFFTI